MIDYIIEAFLSLFYIKNITALTVGSIVGVILGAIPGIGSSTSLAVLLPFTFGMDIQPSVLFLISIYGGAEYGGSISAIAINTPGTGGAIATALDGYPLTEKGFMGPALLVSLVTSVIGGIISTIFLITLAPTLANFGLRFGPAEMFSLGLFGLTIIVSLSQTNLLKGFISAGLGLLLATIGIDPIVGTSRFSFGIVTITAGINLIPIMIGLFALSEAFRMLESKKGIYIDTQVVKGLFDTIKDTIKLIDNKRVMAICTLRASLIGTIIGIVPGAGANVAAFVAYNEEKRASKHPEKFGTGVFEGVAAPEAANNAVVGGALVPTLALGIPGSGSAALLLGALMMNDVIPGPLMFEQNGDITYLIMIGFLVSNFYLLVFGGLLTKLLLPLSKIRKDILGCCLIVITLVGSYAYRNSETDALTMFIFGVLGWTMRKLKIPIPPLILAFILGDLIERNLLSALLISGGSFLTFFTKPISLILILLSFISLITALMRERKHSKNKLQI